MLTAVGMCCADFDGMCPRCAFSCMRARAQVLRAALIVLRNIVADDSSAMRLGGQGAYRIVFAVLQTHATVSWLALSRAPQPAARVCRVRACVCCVLVTSLRCALAYAMSACCVGVSYDGYMMDDNRWSN